MVELADIFRLLGPEYLVKFGNRMLTSHKKAMQDIEQCRTPVLGGKVFACPKCGRAMALIQQFHRTTHRERAPPNGNGV